MSNFFEGQDFHDGVFKALDPKYYPPQYQRYIAEETERLIRAVKGQEKILEAGVGTGRLIPVLAPLVKEFVGIDNAERMLRESRAIAAVHGNAKIVAGNLEELESIFQPKEFTTSLCVWNTLGNVENELKVFEQLRGVTRGSIIITVYKKGTIAERKNWYQTVGIEIDHVDTEQEIFFTKSGLRSKSYSLHDIQTLAARSGLQVVDSAILAGVILWVEMKSNNT